jgi:membrane-associated protease RseP (regulator of RpoE activity)
MSLPPPSQWPPDPFRLNGHHPRAGGQAVQPGRKFPLLHLVLFLGTLLTTTMAGAFQQGADPFTHPAALAQGLPFALTLMAILFSHEMGHYLFAQAHGVRASLPYFIPGLPFFVGTFGAFIRLKSLPADRNALFDVGAAGPWAGVIVAVPAVVIGLALSEVRPLSPLDGGLVLGDSFLFSVLTRLALGVSADDVSVILHPVALAGWFGLFVTFLNLLPVGQLDGGHVVYSLSGGAHRWVSRAAVATIFLLGFQGWQGWFVWVALLFMLGLDHPPIHDAFSPLDRRRTFYAWCTVGLFVLTFMPVPVAFVERQAFPTGEAVPVAYRTHQPAATGRAVLFAYRP